jgi:putative endopeptidase
MGYRIRFAALIAFTIFVYFQLSAAGQQHGIDKSAMDLSVRPGIDFFSYANGNWVKSTEIPADQPSWGTFRILRDEAAKRLAALIQDASKAGATPGSNAQKVGDYFATYMDEASIEKKGRQPIKNELDHIIAISNKQDLARTLGSTLRADVDALNNTNFYTENILGLWTSPGFSDPDHYVPYLLQGGLGMPDREYYLSNNPKMIEMRKAYSAHISAVLKLAGVSDSDTKASQIADLEHKIAEAHTNRAESEDVLKANNPWSREDFAKKAPGMDWVAFFEGARLSHQQTFIVWQPHAVTGIAAAANDTPIDVWKNYLIFHRINRDSNYLSSKFVKEHFDFHDKTLAGTPQMRERWKRAVDVTNYALGDAVGELYVKKYFTPQAKAAALAMVGNIKAAFAKRIDTLPWMSAATKAKAKEKVAALYVGIGYPEKWLDYSTLEIVRGDAYGNRQRAEKFEYDRQISRLGKKVDRSEWCMTPQTVNAVNLPLQNALNFPAAILEKPFFDDQANAVVNYGAVGTVIGHEISHSFDDQGAQFDANGRLFNWWTKSDFAHFKQEAERLAKQYDAYAPFPDLHVNGHQTLSENIADVAGLSAAFDGWKASLQGKPAPMVQGLTAEQVFFIAFAQNWRSKAREQALRQQILTDGHSPGPYRAAAVRNLDPWYAAFGVKGSDAFYLAPQDRVRVW